jgi:serine protease Do
VKNRNTVLLMLVLIAGVVVAAVLASRISMPHTFAQIADLPTTATNRVPSSFGADRFREIAQAQTPMVVNIRTESRRQTRDLSDFFDGGDLFERFFGRPQRGSPREQITEGAGSGFVIDDGLILTNSHVVTGANRITVAFYAGEQGEEYEARVIGRDPLTDSALIELTERPPRQPPVARMGRSADVRPGDWVMAIGNPFNLAHTVTVGVISAINRPFPVSEGHWQQVLQTDAAINPGNSGGPLLNLRGEVVGINTAIVANGGAGNVGVGFAIPIDAVRDLLPELRKGSVRRGRIGVQVSPVTRRLVEPLGLKDSSGALVRSVDQNGPAAAAGIEPGDVIVRFNGEAIADTNQLVQVVSRSEPGSTVPVEVVRNGSPLTLQVKVAVLELGEGATALGASASETGFGMSLQPLTPQLRAQLQVPQGRSGAVVAEVQQGSAAARAGIRAGDVLLEVNRRSVGSAADASAALRTVKPGDTAFALVLRQGQEVFVIMTRE